MATYVEDLALRRSASRCFFEAGEEPVHASDEGGASRAGDLDLARAAAWLLWLTFASTARTRGASDEAASAK